MKQHFYKASSVIKQSLWLCCFSSFTDSLEFFAVTQSFQTKLGKKLKMSLLALVMSHTGKSSKCRVNKILWKAVFSFVQLWFPLTTLIVYHFAEILRSSPERSY